jgi:hypothetical protein
VSSVPSENGFVRTHLEHRYGGVVITVKSRNAFIRGKAVAALVPVRRLSGMWRPLLIETQGYLCEREAVSYRCRKLQRGKFCAHGFARNLKMY